MMKEAEMDTLAMLWANTRVAHLLAVWRMTPEEVGDDQEGGCYANHDGPLMYTQKVETLEPFSSHVIPMKMAEAYLGEHINVMMQALHAQDGTLPPGLTMQNTYTELRKGSKKAVVVVQNHTIYPKLSKRRPPWQGQWLYNQYLKPPNLGVYRLKMRCALTLKLQS